jgi:hypothetical protein
VRGEPGEGEVPAPDTAEIGLAVFASSRAEHSYGLQWSAAATDRAGRSVTLRLVSGAKGVTPDQVRIDLHPAGAAAVELGAPLVWKVGERVLRTEGPSGLFDVQSRLAAYLGASFGQAGTADLERLEAVVRPVLDRGDYTVCDYGPSPGRGIPGPCLPRAPTEAERAAHRAAFDAELARRREALGAAETWSELLASIAPVP